MYFGATEAYFEKGSVAKYTFVYMAQPLTIIGPLFCLACMGTDNKFNTNIFVKCWQYIHDQLKQKGIFLVSVGVDRLKRV